MINETAGRWVVANAEGPGGRTTWTDRVWVRLAETYQPMRAEFPESGPMVWRPYGERRPSSHKIGPRLTLAMLSVARVLDVNWSNGATASQVAGLMGMSQSAVSKALALLVKEGWLEVVGNEGRATCYRPNC